MNRQAFSFDVPIARIPAAGRHFRVELGEEERKAVAASLGIEGVTALVADLEVRPSGADAFAVRGNVAGTVVQTDVVALEPVAQEVNEPVDLMLFPAEPDRAGKKADRDGSLATEERDLYRNGRIDLGAIVVEHLALGLDPYPRSPGVEFSGHVESVPDAGSSPFAALSRLKRERE